MRFNKELRKYWVVTIIFLIRDDISSVSQIERNKSDAKYGKFIFGGIYSISIIKYVYYHDEINKYSASSDWYIESNRFSDFKIRLHYILYGMCVFWLDVY